MPPPVGPGSKYDRNSITVDRSSRTPKNTIAIVGPGTSLPSSALNDMSVLNAVDGPLQRHRNVPILSSDSLKTVSILAFAERLLLAINGPERAFRSRPVYPRKQTLGAWMSVNGGKADIICRRGFGCF